MLKFNWVLFVACIISFSASSATLTPAQGVSILYINGHEAKSKIGKNEIPKGENQLIVRMDKQLGRGGSRKVFTSDPYVLSVLVSGDKIKIGHPVARSVSEANRAFRQSVPGWQLTQDGEKVDFTQEPLPKKQGAMPFLDLGSIVSDYNESRGIEFSNDIMISSQAGGEESQVTKSNEQPKQLPVKSNDSGLSLEQVKVWYKAASKMERRAFHHWVLDEEIK
ncbi:DUF2057 domain-containing protein [Vibrio lamellibrachiae]|uniref:DUF2057 family protein n=1 Tax=Vibrio lamellibrachiae TaxID=2910253 RepID=UPI003D0AFC41